MEVKLHQLTCIDCKIDFWITDTHDSVLRNTHVTFCCPNGHSQWYPGKTNKEIIFEKNNIISEKISRILQLEKELAKKYSKKKSKK